MPAHNPKITTAQEVPEKLQDKPTLQDTPTETDATKAYVAQSHGSPTAADGDPYGSVIPTIPGYTIEGILGRGGMGVVYRARQTELHRPVAIKMILGGKYTDPVAQARFLMEAEVIAAIQHPNIVQVHEFGRHDDQPFFVLEFVGGGGTGRNAQV